jgi:farnesyl diphosphate synthase
MPTTIQEFEGVWPRIVADLQAHCRQYKLPQQSLDWFTKVPST